MNKAIFLKEWLKTRRVFWVSLLLALLFALYAIMGIRRVVATHGVEHVWLIMLMKDQTFIDALKYLPAVIGVAIGAAQMSPETSLKRLKLTLHLPYSQNRMVCQMIGFGLMECLTVYLIQAAAVAGYYLTVVTPGMTAHVMLTALPWYIAGLDAYLFTAAICLEGKWSRRIILGLTGLGVITVFFMQPAPQAYNGILAGALVFTVILITLSIYSVNRFKEGLID